MILTSDLSLIVQVDDDRNVLAFDGLVTMVDRKMSGVHLLWYGILILATGLV